MTVTVGTVSLWRGWLLVIVFGVAVVAIVVPLLLAYYVVVRVWVCSSDEDRGDRGRCWVLVVG